MSAYGRTASRTLLVPDAQAGSTKPGWSRKRKTWSIVAVLGVTVVIIVAVVVPVVVTQRQKNTRASYREMYLPEGYSGTGVNGLVDGTKQATSYDRLVVFGSSYSDNAHPRAAEYSGSFAGSGYWEGRYSDGPVWVEYLKDYLGPKVAHLNYAYAGATTNNSIHPANVPDTGEQMAYYMENDYDAKMKPVVAMFTTTNDITATFRDLRDPASAIHQNYTRAIDVITQSAASVINQLYTLIPSDVSAVAPDFLILPIIPVHLAPQSALIANQTASGDTDSIRQITREYNNALLKGAKAIAQRLGSRGNVYTYDVPSWFYSMVTDPTDYSLQSTVTSYTEHSTGSVTGYIWYDYLHLTTHIQKKLARMCANILLDKTVMP